MRNLRPKGDKGLEFDIVLVNGTSIAIVEVKYKATTKHIKHLIRLQAQHIKDYYPEYRNHSVYCALATMACSSQLVARAEDAGIFLLTQQGEHLAVNARNIKPIIV